MNSIATGDDGARGAPREDPYEVFNRVMGLTTVRTPHPAHAALRSKGAVFELFSGGRLEPAPAGPERADSSPAQGTSERAATRWFEVFGHAAVSQILKSPRVFSSRIFPPNLWLAMGHTLIQMDDPQHSEHRALHREFFSPERIDAWEHTLVRPVVNGLVDAFADRGHADLMRELAALLPFRVLCRIIGYPDAKQHDIHLWAIHMLCAVEHAELGIMAANELSAYITELLDERRREPRDDLLTWLLGARLEGRPLSQYEILSFLRLITPAGFETTFRGLANTLFGLLTHPAQLAAVRADRRLVDAAIEEGLRWETSDVKITRRCMQDTEVCGSFIPAGALVKVSLASANHDEATFEDADSFDVHREAKAPHLSFGAGAHYCLGARLARMELRVAIDVLLDRFPALRLDPAWDDPHIRGDIFRGPERLPVLF